MVLNVGGVSALLGLIAMAADVEGLYAAVKALVCVVRSNKNAQREMTRTDGYKVKFKSGIMNHGRTTLLWSIVQSISGLRRQVTAQLSDHKLDLG